MSIATSPAQARIFVVDDEPVNLKLVDKLLTTEGYGTLHLIGKPEEVLPSYQQQRPDLILLDLNMPGLDGFGVLQQLQALKDPLLPPVIILTAQNGRDFLLKALQAGARDFISKPFDRNELLLRVRNAIDARLAQLHLEQRVQERTQELQTANEHIKASFLTTVRSLVNLMELRNSHLAGQGRNAAQMARKLARHMGVPDEEVQRLVLAALLHHIGMVGIPDAILEKPVAHLTSREQGVFRKHAEWGAQVLQGMDDMPPVAAVVRAHHECYNGQGYPDKLSGEQIPLLARILAVATAYCDPAGWELTMHENLSPDEA
ncbi:HD domain-containing phosphohydrolase [Macromonas bipunctata]|uniref:HD domain-containing phosphohydrolase n=1 Tax=Macromonas bipunctata TaxID=183670 RepID=UPI0011AF62E6|nr:HD domain-containing phosphohydrolase [Macromonas bipunctata]